MSLSTCAGSSIIRQIGEFERDGVTYYYAYVSFLSVPHILSTLTHNRPFCAIFYMMLLATTHVDVPHLQGQLTGPGSLLFRAGMSVEAKDRQNPSMICVAKIRSINPQGKLLIHFDGWSQQYDYWCEPSSLDIHPPMWCGKNGRKVEAPNGEVTDSCLVRFMCDPVVTYVN